MSEAAIRPIRATDDAALAAIIRSVMPEFGADGDGFAITDPEVDTMHRAYTAPRAAYWVVDLEGRVAGGCGFAPLEGGPSTVCELRKMYFLPELRGLGVGRRLLELCLSEMPRHGFEACYIETLAGMDAAMALYESVGFEPLDAPMGNTGHHGCDRFYLRALR
ncbi:MAG: GNAT family N-acetyltransferase [Planctomycetota bacterium]